MAALLKSDAWRRTKKIKIISKLAYLYACMEKNSMRAACVCLVVAALCAIRHPCMLSQDYGTRHYANYDA